MKIALPVAGGQLCAHFGHCDTFEVFEVDRDSGKIIKTSSIQAPPHEPGLLPRMLGAEGIDVVIAGGMGSRAQDLFRQQGIEVLVGVAAGDPTKLVESYLSGTLKSGTNICDH